MKFTYKAILEQISTYASVSALILGRADRSLLEKGSRSQLIPTDQAQLFEVLE